jgi:hypothetical protein
MIKKITTELIYFLALLLILSFLQHSDLLSSPLQRFNLMIDQGNFIHPFIWTFGLYILIGFIRLIIKYIIFLKNKKKK